MNIALLLSRAARAHREKIALRQGNYSLSYAQVNERTSRLAAALRHLGVDRGERLAILQHNSPAYVESLFAAFRIGAIAVPLNARLHAREIAYILQQSGSKALIFGSSFGEAIGEIAAETAVAHYIDVGGQSGHTSLEYETLLAKHSPEFSDAEMNEDEVAWLFYTSGTTGRPKGAMLTHRNLLQMAMNFYSDHSPVSETDIALYAAPLSHGCGLYLLPVLAKGARAVLHASTGFDPELLCLEIQREKATMLPFVVPTQVKKLATCRSSATADFATLQLIVWGGAPMYVEEARCAQARFGPILSQLYGLGEAPMTVTALGRRAMALELAGNPGLLTAGLPRTDVEIRVLDDSGAEAPTGVPGEVTLRGGVVMKGYWNDPEATAKALRHGWFYTGDIGYMDERGYLFLVDRKHDVIISGGSNIYPREVEEALLEHPEVSEAVVFGVPDSEWGESVKAAIVARDRSAPPTSEELIAFCRTRIASYKKPRDIVFVEAIPRNAYGKTMRRVLRETFGKK